jgi:ABC transporter DrrB family efflux protein
MSADTTTRTSASGIARPEIRPTGLLRQSWAITRRNLIHIKRMPEMLMDVTIQPVMFVLLFAYVFGGSIAVQGSPAGYREWLMGGIMGQTIAFASFIVAVGLTADIDKGIVDRMRSLPINPAAVLVGRSISSLMHSSIGILVMSVTGLFVGWRIRDGLPNAVLAYLLLLMWGFAMIWVGILVGSAMRSVEAVNGLMFTTMFPITFLANTFAPTDRMPHWLRVVAEWNPISSLVQSVRQLWGNDLPVPADAQLPLHHPILTTLIWTIGLTVVVAPLAIRAFRRRTQG